MSGLSIKPRPCTVSRRSADSANAWAPPSQTATMGLSFRDAAKPSIT